MTTTVNWTNPYENRTGNWYRGNLHAHTSPASGCGAVSLDRVLQLYRHHKLDFLSLSDHMTLTDASHDGLILIPGLEWNSATGGHHTGIYSCDTELLRSCIPIQSHDELLAHLQGHNALVILNHPNWQLRPHYRREELEEKSSFDGLEIYNGVIERLDGYAISTDKWDYLLSKKRRVLGFASDDSHEEADIAQAWNCVRAAEPTAEAILHAMQTGNFYCSTGVIISDIRREGDQITIETENAVEIRVDTERGRIARVRDKAITFSLSTVRQQLHDLLERVKDTPWAGFFNEDHMSYVRFTAYGPAPAMAWTQPFFLK